MHTLHRRSIFFRYSSRFMALAILAGAQGLDATPGMGDDFACDACVVLDSEELDTLRGGFQFAGLNFEFGANIRSFIDNTLVLESIVTITTDGVIQHQAIRLPGADDSRSPFVPQGTGGTSAADSNLPIATGPATAASMVVPDNIDLTGLSNALGVSINDHKGFTAALHEATRERIISTLINTASDRKLRQETVRHRLRFCNADSR